MARQNVTDSNQTLLEKLREFTFCRFSHTSLMVDDELVLIGGVSNECPPPGCAVINLNSKQCMERPLPVSNECPQPGCAVINSGF